MVIRKDDVREDEKQNLIGMSLLLHCCRSK